MLVPFPVVRAQTPPAASGVQGWYIRPSLTISETYSDNVSLATSGASRSELTTRVAPTVAVSGNSARLHFNGTYTPEFLYRANQGTNNLSHYLNATGNAELIKHSLFLDARASVSQQNVSLLAPQADNNLNITNNRTTVKAYGISPFIRHEFGFDAIGELRYTHDAVHYGSNTGSLSSSTSDGVSGRLTSGPAFRLFTWGLTASQSHLKNNQNSQKIDAQNYAASVGRLILPDLRLTASVGYEDSGYPSSAGRELKGIYWSVGPTWTPTERTQISATVGRRYFGPSRTLTLSHRTRLTVWAFDYNESVTNTRGSIAIPPNVNVATFLGGATQFQQYTDPAERAQRVQQFIQQNSLPEVSTSALNFLTDSLFLEKRLGGSVGFLGVRNNVLANVFTSNRSSLTTGGFTGDFGGSTNVRQTGGGIVWNSTLAPNFSSNVSLSYSKNEITGLNRTDRRLGLRIGLTKAFSPKVSGSLFIGRVQNDSNVAISSYTENSVTATLGMGF